MTKKFDARPLVGEKYRDNIGKKIYTVERVRPKSVDLLDEQGGAQTWFMDAFMTLANAGIMELVESKHRGTFA